MEIKTIGRIFSIVFLIAGLFATGYSLMNGIDSDAEWNLLYVGISSLAVFGILAWLSN